MVTPQRDVDTNATVNETAVNVDAAKRMVETMRKWMGECAHGELCVVVTLLKLLYTFTSQLCVNL